MSSRQEEKQRRREERLAEEEKAASTAARTRRLQLVGGAVLVLAVIVVAAVLISGSGGGDSGKGPNAKTASAKVALPKPGPNAAPDKLQAAAADAGCKATDPPIQGSTHVSSTVKYKTNPPTSGNHNPNPASDGIYDPGNTPAKEHYVHSLEHGRIEIQYRPGTPQKTRDQLETLFGEKTETKFGTPSENGSYTLLFENNTNMPYEVAATAWGHMLACPKMNDKVFDAIRSFRAAYTLQAPEKILQQE